MSSQIMNIPVVNQNDSSNSLLEQDPFALTPPVPPLQQEQTTPGNFDYIKSVGTREMLANAYQSINQLELWNYMKQDTDSYMMSLDPEIRRISAKIDELGYHNHSGVSFGWTMRQMQHIAKYGESHFKTEWMKYEK
jgi:hypothetical protein